MFERGRYLIADAARIRLVLANTEGAFAARAPAFSDVEPQPALARSVTTPLARWLDAAWRALPESRIDAELSASFDGKTIWPFAARTALLRLFAERLFPGAPPATIDKMDHALRLSRSREGHSESPWLALWRRIAHHRAKIALRAWFDARGEAADGFERALFEALAADDDMALALHGAMVAVCHAAATALSWTMLLEHGWRLGVPVGEALPSMRIDTPAADRVREASRLWPVAWLLQRTARRSVDLPGLSLQPGDDVYLCTFLLQRDSSTWSAPEDYRPERWMNPPARYQDSYLPYGAGTAASVGTCFVNDIAARVLEIADQRRPSVVRVLDEKPALGALASPPRFTVRTSRRIPTVS